MFFPNSSQISLQNKQKANKEKKKQCKTKLHAHTFSILCVLCMLPYYLWAHLYTVPFHICKMLFPWSHPPSLILTIFPLPFPCRSLSLEGQGLIKTSHLGLSAPEPVTLCTLSIQSLCCKKTLCWWGWIMLWPMGIAVYQESSYCCAPIADNRLT